MPPTRIPTITQKQVASFLKPRPQDSHKGMFGTVAVIGGDSGMIGAAVLAGRAALKLGAGCVQVGLLADKMPLIDMRMPELMLNGAQSLIQQNSVIPAKAGIQQDKRTGFPPTRERQTSVLVVGCGLGQSLAAHKLLYDALQLDIPLVLDADALNILALRPDLRGMLHTRKAAAVFTPHPGEAARLLACKTEDIQNDRTTAVRKLAKKLNGSIVLKGMGSLCATVDGKLYINKTGNPGMSSAGMGDVLAGMIAAFIAQGLTADQALLLGVHLHGAAGDALAQQQATIGISATEVTEWARFLLNQWLG